MSVFRFITTVPFVGLFVFAPPGLAAYSKNTQTTPCYVSTGQACTTGTGQAGMFFVDRCTDGPTKCIATASNFEPEALLGPRGGHIQVAGHVLCEAGAVADLRVTITQRGSGAVAEGSTQIACDGEEIRWEAQAATMGRGGFIPGTATVCGLLELRTGRLDPADALQWCRQELELEP